jgi:hypothetical protein
MKVIIQGTNWLALEVRTIQEHKSAEVTQRFSPGGVGVMLGEEGCWELAHAAEAAARVLEKNRLKLQQEAGK